MKHLLFFISFFAGISFSFGQSAINCTALKNGCRIISSPKSFYTSDIHTSKIDSWTIQALLDENGTNGWCSAAKENFPMTFVFELSEDFFLEKLIFDNNCQREYPGICAREVKVEVSTSGPETGFRETSVYILKERAKSEFSVNSVGARWIRMTILSNYGHKEMVELMEFQVMGRYVNPAQSPADIKGLWDTNFDWVSINSNENGYIYGCYKWADGELYSGKIDRRTFTFRFKQKADGKEGWATVNLNKEGNRLSGIWGFGNDNSQFGFWDFIKKSSQPNPCGNDQAVKNIKPDSSQAGNFPEIKDDRIPLNVQLIDVLTNQAIDGKVTVSNSFKVIEQKATYEGKTSFLLPPVEKSISVKGESSGYMSVTEPMDSSRISGPGLVIKLRKLEAGKSVVMENIRFEQGKFDLLPQSYEELDKIVQMMNEYPNMEIELAGHTDNQGDPKKNVLLSENRVKEVKNYLVSKGIKASRISGIGYGGGKPISSNAKEETRKLNRRVEFKIIKM